MEVTLGGSRSWNAHAVRVRGQDALAPRARSWGECTDVYADAGSCSDVPVCYHHCWYYRGAAFWGVRVIDPQASALFELCSVSLLPSRKGSWDSGLPEDMGRSLLPRFIRRELAPLSPPSPALAESTPEFTVRRRLWAWWFS